MVFCNTNMGVITIAHGMGSISKSSPHIPVLHVQAPFIKESHVSSCVIPSVWLNGAGECKPHQNHCKDNVR
jgi:hypothetical protein